MQSLEAAYKEMAGRKNAQKPYYATSKFQTTWSAKTHPPKKTFK